LVFKERSKIKKTSNIMVKKTSFSQFYEIFKSWAEIIFMNVTFLIGNNIKIYL
jgi:hypothetical protein